MRLYDPALRQAMVGVVLIASDATMEQAGGGFLPLSPAATSVTSSRTSRVLPSPRSSALRPGGSKESSFIRHVDQRILYIQRRFAKRRQYSGNTGILSDEQGRSVEETTGQRREQQAEQWQDVPGYNSFAEAGREVEELIGVIWVSGTPSLQIPYLISLALLINTMIPAFPASPKQLFRVVGKLDHAFASLLQGRDVETGEPLPGFSTGRKVSTTEKVRIKSLVERTRVSVANVMASGEMGSDESDHDDEEVNMEDDLILDATDAVTGEPSDWNMDVAKVFDLTIVEIGDSLDGPDIGIRTEPR